MNIVVTGGHGFIGSHLCRYLTAKGANVYNIDSLTYACDYVNITRVPTVETLRFDIVTDQIKLDKWFKCHPRFDAIIHLAAETHVDNSIHRPCTFASTNVVGTCTMLNIAKRYYIPKYVQVSTDEVYGSLEEGEAPWDESRLLEPNSPYSASKASGDLLALSYYKTFGMDIRITRCCNNFGIGQHIEKLIPKSIMSAKKYDYIDIYGNGRNEREWIHAEDHARGIYKVLQYGQQGEIYNIGTGETFSNNEIANMIIERVNPKASISYIKDRPGHDKKYQVDYSKIEKIGFRPRRSIKDEKEWDEMVRYYEKY
tara:strand:- start:2581 stop:3516 length:936 start_codon:yes stop_codon:yes gene_type:complete